MGVSGQLHVLAALNPGEEPPGGWRGAGRPGCCAEERNLLLLPRNEPSFLWYTVRNLVDIMVEIY
jgi:hypothetical protein